MFLTPLGVARFLVAPLVQHFVNVASPMGHGPTRAKTRSGTIRPVQLLSSPVFKSLLKNVNEFTHPFLFVNHCNPLVKINLNSDYSYSKDSLGICFYSKSSHVPTLCSRCLSIFSLPFSEGCDFSKAFELDENLGGIMDRGLRLGESRVTTLDQAYACWSVESMYFSPKQCCSVRC